MTYIIGVSSVTDMESDFRAPMPLQMNLHEPMFDTRQLIAAVPGLLPTTLSQWKVRGYIRLLVDEGQGHRPIYPPIDVLQAALAREVSNLGAPALSKLPVLWHQVLMRLSFLDLDPAGAELVWLLYVDRASEELHIGRLDPANLPPETPGTPDAWVAFPVDRFVRRAFDRMNKVLAGEAAEILPRPVSGDFDFDEYGRRTFVGLSLAESREMVRLGAEDDRTADDERRFRTLEYQHLLARWRRELAHHEGHPDPMDSWTRDATGRPIRWGLDVEESGEFVDIKARYMARRGRTRLDGCADAAGTC